MKNFFIPLLLITSFILPLPADAGIYSAADQTAHRSTDRKKNEEDLKKLYKEIPDLNNKEQLTKYLQHRLKIVQRADFTPEEAATPTTTSVINLDDVRQKSESTVSAYEKIYEDSMKRASEGGTLNENIELDGTFYRLAEEDTTPETFVPDFPYVTIKLSDEKEIMAPAEEHIAYMLTKLKIEPTGLMKITEEFVLVSNNENFPEGFIRILPKYIYSRNNTARRLDLTLQNVTVNGNVYPYKITEIGNYLHIEPQKPLELPTGIYTYRFSYIVDRAVWFYDDFDEFYWDMTAKTLINVVGSANAVVILPEGKTFLAQNALVSTLHGMAANPERVTITTLSPGTLAFADTEALAVGDDIHLFITLEKGTLIAPDFLKKYLWLIQDHGAVIFALLTLLAIFISYKISLAQIRRNQDKTRANLKKTPAMFRLINTGAYDSHSLFAEILDLVAKNIIEILPDQDSAVLVKKTDNLKKLTKNEQKLITLLFPGEETSLPSNNRSKLKIERAYKYLRRTIYRRFHAYVFKLNALYLAFSTGMLLCGIAAASAIAVNPTHTFWVIFFCSLLMTPYICLFFVKFKSNACNLAAKAFALLSILGIAGWLSIYTSNIYAVIIILTLWLIIFYYRAFSRRSGLLRNKIKETEEYKSYLQKNPELAATARDFTVRIPYIYAFGLENKYKDTKTFKLISCYEQLFTPQTKKD